jgi:hypothetical protein
MIPTAADAFVILLVVAIVLTAHRLVRIGDTLGGALRGLLRPGRSRRERSELVESKCDNSVVDDEKTEDGTPRKD